MKFDERFLEELKSRLRLSDVIGRTVKLRRQGREYVGLSPFSKEKSPSFFVNDEKGFFHDFSSNKHGDLISFLQETERLSFPEAVERLAAEAGLALPAPDARDAEAEAKRQTLTDWLELAARWFEAELRRPGGADACAYLDRRGLPESERARFGVGYAPAGRTGLKDYLIAKGARAPALVEAGLLIAPEDGGQPYDRFRDRIMFPIADGRGRIISFGGRALNAEAKAKYLNGPETALFHKGSTLYGLAEAKKLLHTSSDADAPLVVVEGYMDVIACQRAGVAAVAPLGTALTEEQMGALWRLHPEPTLCFDGDGAGQRAAARVIDRALPLLKPGRSCRFALITGGKDPDEVLREQGAAALKAQLALTRPFVDVLFERERAAAEPLDTPERRTALKVAFRKLAGQIADADLAQSYRDELLRRYEALWPLQAPAYTASDAARALRNRPRKGKGPPPGGATPEGKAAARRLSLSLRPVAAAVALALLENPEWIDDQLETLEVQGLGDQGLAEIAKEIIRFRLMSSSLDSATLRRHLASLGYDAILKEISRAAVGSHAPFLQSDLPPERARLLWSRALAQLIQIAALERALRDAIAELDQDESLYRVVPKLKVERDALRRDVGSGTVWLREAALDPDSGSATLH
jgi:DNA primase